MTESKLCKSCQNTENCPCWSAKQTGRVISCHFYQEVPSVNMPDSLKKAHDEGFHVDREALTQGSSLSSLLREDMANLEVLYCASLVKRTQEQEGECAALKQQVSVLRTELMDAIQAHEDDTTALRKQVDNQRKSLIRADKQAVKLIRQRKEWKEACAQLALEHNQLIEENEALKKDATRFYIHHPIATSRADTRVIQNLRTELFVQQQAAKLNKEAEVVALELLGEQKEKNKKLEFKLQTSRAITCVVFLLAVTYHYFF